MNQFIYTYMNPTFWYCSAPKCTGITPQFTWKLRASPQCNHSHDLMLAHSESILHYFSEGRISSLFADVPLRLLLQIQKVLLERQPDSAIEIRIT